jgi:hypothetical protein
VKGLPEISNARLLQECKQRPPYSALVFVCSTIEGDASLRELRILPQSSSEHWMGKGLQPAKFAPTVMKFQWQRYALSIIFCAIKSTTLINNTLNGLIVQAFFSKVSFPGRFLWLKERFNAVDRKIDLPGWNQGGAWGATGELARSDAGSS